jgi:hypothetical protein
MVHRSRTTCAGRLPLFSHNCYLQSPTCGRIIPMSITLRSSGESIFIVVTNRAMQDASVSLGKSLQLYVLQMRTSIRRLRCFNWRMGDHTKQSLPSCLSVCLYESSSPGATKRRSGSMPQKLSNLGERQNDCLSALSHLKNYASILKPHKSLVRGFKCVKSISKSFLVFPFLIAMSLFSHGSSHLSLLSVWLYSVLLWYDRTYHSSKSELPR